MKIDPGKLSTTATLTYAEEFNSFDLWDGRSGLDTRPGFAMASWANQGFAWSAASDTWYLQPDAYDPQAGDTFHVQDGVLTITAQRSDTLYRDPKGAYGYTSGVITTYHEFSQLYGYFEIRAQVSTAAGTLPAFWLLPTDNSWPPELDVMEVVGSDPETLYTTVHSQVDGVTRIDDTHRQTGNWTSISDASASFHTYGVDWQADTITWYVDGVKVAQVATPSDMHKPMYMIANLNVGGVWEGRPAADQSFSASFKIDYIRAYTARPETAPDTPQPTLPDDPALPIEPSIDKILVGTSAKNTLAGQSGDDIINGKSNRDVLVGGAGSDAFVFDTKLAKSNTDTIKDFTARDDAIWLDKDLFKSNKSFYKSLKTATEDNPIKLSKAFFTADGKAKDGNDYLVYNKKSGVLSYDKNGSEAGGLVEIAKLSNKAAISHLDIFII
ncbi:family 16 glycosylhydrolase [Microvirga sesbaniae]|uniref:family 16 glycosylhydrolase n=1 Tax=Microvirga sesbaniae TaxID=681392 RepID=UPI0021C796A0|nr:family 16 glycosylhydrolase [Microvirga sp. HBU67692]